MASANHKEPTHFFADPVFWADIVESSREMLRINICVVNSRGWPIYVSEDENRYGWRSNVDLFSVQARFEHIGNGHFQYVDQYGFHYYAIEILDVALNIVGYVVLGPIIMNKKAAFDEYQRIAQESGENYQDLCERLEEVRILSQVGLEAVLRTIDALLNIPDKLKRRNAGHDAKQALLEHLFNISLIMAGSESGSLMVFNEGTGTLVVRISKGIDDAYKHSQVNLTDGISGIAFKQGKTLLLKGHEDSRSFSALLRRTEIKESIVMPFTTPNKGVRGVLNINRLRAPKGEDLMNIEAKISKVVGDVLADF